MFLLRYIETEEVKLEGKQRLEYPGSPYSLFGYVRKNGIHLALETKNRRIMGHVQSGEIFYIPQGCHWTMNNRADRSLSVALIRFSCEMESAVLPEFSKCCPDEYRLVRFRLPMLRQWLEDFKLHRDTRSPELYYRLQSYLYTIASAFFAACQQPKNTDDDLWGYVERTKLYMLNNYGTPMDIEELAQGSGGSSGRFYEAFRRQVGISPRKFMTTVRLNASLSLLSNAESVSVMDAAHAVGYPDEYYFSRLFKKQMGMAPTEYAERAKKKIANLAPVFLGDLSVMGITPEISLERGWFRQPEQHIESIRNGRPELILTHPIPEDLHRVLSGIAPVVAIHWKGYPWKDRLMDIGSLLGLSPIASRWLSYFDQKVDNARQLIRECMGNKPFLIVSAWNNRFRIFGMRMKKMKDLFYDDLRVMPPAPAREISFLDVASVSEVAALDCDNVLFLVSTSLPQQFCYELEEEWARWKPNKQCILLRYEDHLFYNASIHEALVDQMVSQLIQYGGRSRKVHAKKRKVHWNRSGFL